VRCFAEYGMSDGVLHPRRQEAEPGLALEALQLGMLGGDGLDGPKERLEEPGDGLGGRGGQLVYPLDERSRHLCRERAKQDLGSPAAGFELLQNGPHLSANIDVLDLGGSRREVLDGLAQRLSACGGPRLVPRLHVEVFCRRLLAVPERQPAQFDQLVPGQLVRRDESPAALRAIGVDGPRVTQEIAALVHLREPV
jgi:hypothetical protein